MYANEEDRSEDFAAVADLAEVFTDLVSTLTDGGTVPLDSARVVELARRGMPRAEHVGLVVRGGEGLQTVAASDTLVQDLDRLRQEVDEAPVLDALEANDVVCSDDLADDPRWPAFGDAVVRRFGIRSIAVYRLYLGRGRPAALTFLSSWPAAFDELAVSTGAILAAYCSLTLFTEQVLAEQVTARRSAQVHQEIGVAVGMLAASSELGVEHAYRRLHAAAKSLQRSAHDVATHVIDHRVLPGPDRPG